MEDSFSFSKSNFNNDLKMEIINNSNEIKYKESNYNELKIILSRNNIINSEIEKIIEDLNDVLKTKKNINEIKTYLLDIQNILNKNNRHFELILNNKNNFININESMNRYKNKLFNIVKEKNKIKFLINHFILCKF